MTYTLDRSSALFRPNRVTPNKAADCKKHNKERTQKREVASGGVGDQKKCTITLIENRLDTQTSSGSRFTQTPIYPMISLPILSDLLWALDGVPQDPLYHPEGDALFHSLQVFQHAKQHSTDPEMWAAALLHDIGKAIQTRDHAAIGAELLDDLVPPRVVWLVRHHMDLLLRPHKIRKKLRGTPQLYDLEQLRRWDQAGRDPDAHVVDPDQAIELIAIGLFSPTHPRKGKR